MSSSHSAPSKVNAARAVGLVCSVMLALICVTALSSGTAHASPQPRHSISIGNQHCGTVGINPYANLTGGEQMRVRIVWKGSASNGKCNVTSANCPDFFGTCNAGYWIAGLFCSTLAAMDLADAQGDCDLNNIVVLSDYNAGPNNAPDNHGTSYNQCSTVATIGSIFGGLPGTLNCVPDGDGTNGWSEHYPRGAAPTGTAYGPVEETGSSTPFNPATSGVDCPPSAANIQAGALPGYCAFVVLPIDFQYYCAAGICVPDPGDANDGVTENTSDYIATLLQYANAPANTQPVTSILVKS
jgi:hypothetical protein